MREPAKGDRVTLAGDGGCQVCTTYELVEVYEEGHVWLRCSCDDGVWLSDAHLLSLVCECNVWAGCSCGVFAAEQRRKGRAWNRWTKSWERVA